MLRVRLFGGLSLEIDGAEVEPPNSRPARAVLGWLALHPGAHPRAEVAALFWPEVLDESARASLRNALSAIRRALGEAGERYLEAGREKVGLVSDVWVDARVFERLASADRLEEAVELCRGELLAGLDQDWVYEERDRHAHRLAGVLARLADAAESAGNLQEAVRRDRQRVELDPLSEDAQRELVRRLAASGDPVGALVAFDKLRERLASQLGVAPSEKTRALAERIRAGDAAAADREPPPLPLPFLRRQRSRFVGRAADLERLRDLWSKASAGERRLILLEGEAGVGKTRLATEFARLAHRDGAVVLLGTCFEEALIPYQPFVEALRPYLAARARAMGSLDPALYDLSPLVPELPARHVGTRDASRGDPEGARYRLFEAVTSLLASESPLVVVLEDLHWADKPTLLLIAHVLRSPLPSALMLLGTVRQDELAPAHALNATIADLRRERLVERAHLRGLSEDEVAALTADWVGPEPPPSLARALHGETNGNAFFVEELLHHLLESGAVRRGGELTLPVVGLPENVREVIARRLARLGEDARAALTLASVAGRRFEHEILEAAGPLGGERLLAALEEALSAQLVREEPGPPGRYAFSHALTREALYEEPSAVRRAGLHRDLAEGLRQLRGDDASSLPELAHHLLEAVPTADAVEAVEVAELAARQAMTQLAYDDAAALLRRALAVDERSQGLGPLARCELLLALGEAEMRAGETTAARGRFQTAAAQARELGAAELLARAALGHAGVGIAIVDVDEPTVELLEQALSGLAQDRASLRARLLGVLAVQLYYAPSRRRTDSLSEQAVEAARRSEDPAVLVDALNARHVTLWGPDHLEERLDIAREMVARAVAAEERERELQARNWLASDHFEGGDIEAFEREVDAHTRLADELRLPTYRWYTPAWRATLALLRGEFSACEQFARQARDEARRGGDRNADLAYDLPHNMVAFERGHMAEPLPWLEEQAAHSPVAVAYRPTLAWLYAEAGREQEARHQFESLAAGGFDSLPRDINWYGVVADLAEACALLRDARRAAALYGLLLPYAERNLMMGRALCTYGSAHRHLGLLAATMSRLPEAAAHFEAAIRSNAAMGARPFVVRGQIQYAAMLRTRDDPGDRELADSLHSEARRTAAELGIELPPARA